MKIAVWGEDSFYRELTLTATGYVGVRCTSNKRSSNSSLVRRVENTAVFEGLLGVIIRMLAQLCTQSGITRDIRCR